MGIRRIASVCVASCALLVTASFAAAQDRFHVLGQNAIAEVQGLRVITIRDDQIAACYTLFIMESAAPPDTGGAPATTPADAAEQSIQRVREAAAKRDRRLGELKAQFEREVGRSHEAWTTSSETSPSVHPDAFKATKYELERKKIDDEFEQVLRTEMPGTYPREVLIPGMRTGGWEDAAEAMRRGITNPDPSTFPERLSLQLESWFKRMIEAPRIAVAGPFACAEAANGRPR